MNPAPTLQQEKKCAIIYDALYNFQKDSENDSSSKTTKERYLTRL